MNKGTADPHHRLAVKARLGVLELQVEAALVAPWTVLFGPSGSGKSSLLRAMAGTFPLTIDQPFFNRRGPGESASLRFERFDESEPVGLQTDLARLKPEARQIAFAPQSASLFPHLTVGENVGFSEARVSRAQASALVDEARDLFELQALWSRRPAALSGGEQQRVNLARAFARPHARLMLLDEPFTGIERTLRDSLLPRLCAALTTRGLPVISVTHDVEEPFLLQADVLRIEGGRLIKRGPAAEVLVSERSALLRNLGQSDPPEPNS